MMAAHGLLPAGPDRGARVRGVGINRDGEPREKIGGDAGELAAVGSDGPAAGGGEKLTRLWREARRR